jgi:hypothetical protein
VNPFNNKPQPSLLERESTGGDIARAGFRFQDEIVLSLIPAWLSYEGFTEMVSEAMGDVEAKFFVPGIGFVREFVEVKDHLVAPIEFWKEIDRFRKMHDGSPGTYRWFRLVSCGLSESLHPLRNSLRRLKGIYGFYDQGSPILENSYKIFQECVLKQNGRSRDDASFLFERVLLETDKSKETVGEARFLEAIMQHLPEYNQMSAMQLKGIVGGLRTLLKGASQRLITRMEIETCFAELGGPKAILDSQPIYIEILTQPRVDLGRRLEFNWSLFFGGEERKFPPSEEWNKIAEDLAQTREWIARHRKKKRIFLKGQQRLPVFIIIGSVFSSVGGFILEYENRDGIWKTNAYPSPGTQAYIWEREYNEGSSSQEIAVSIDVMRGIKEQVRSDLEKRGLREISQLHLFNKHPIVSAEQINAAVDAAKKEIVKIVTVGNTNLIHLYVAGPAQFALFLGHRLKAICNIQTYVWAGADIYSPAYKMPYS